MTTGSWAGLLGGIGLAAVVVGVVLFVRAVDAASLLRRVAGRWRVSPEAQARARLSVLPGNARRCGTAPPTRHRSVVPVGSRD